MTESHRTTHRTTYPVEPPQESFQELADRVVNKLEDFSKNPLERGSGVHHRVIEPLSMEKLAGLATEDLAERLTGIIGDNAAGEHRTERVNAISDEIDKLAETGIDYRAHDPALRERMSFHSAYRGARLASTYRTESGLEDNPTLEQIEGDPNVREQLQQFVDQCSAADQHRLLDNMSGRYAKHASTNEDYNRQSQAALMRLITEIDVKA